MIFYFYLFCLNFSISYCFTISFSLCFPISLSFLLLFFLKPVSSIVEKLLHAAAAAAKSLQSCLTLQRHRRQPTRLRHPWDSPGKNTGMGCHFLLQCMKMKSESEVAQFCPTLSNPTVCSPPGSSIHGILQERVLEWGAIAFSVCTHTYIYINGIYNIYILENL